MQLNRGMRIDAAKQYVADKLKISVSDLNDPIEMSEVREELDIGRISETPAVAKGIDAKCNRNLVLFNQLDQAINIIAERGALRDNGRIADRRGGDAADRRLGVAVVVNVRIVEHDLAPAA